MRKNLLSLLFLGCIHSAHAQTVINFPTNSASGKTCAATQASDGSWSGCGVSLSALTQDRVAEFYASFTMAGDSPPVPVIPPQTLAQQAQATLASCQIAITSKSTPALSASYPCDPATTAKIGAVVTTVVATQAFPGDQSTFAIKDTGGSWHTTTPAQYLAIAGAEAAYVSALSLIEDGNPTNATVLPAASASIP